MSKSLLSSLKLAKRPESARKNPLVRRREKLLAKLAEQKAMATALMNDEPCTIYRDKWTTNEETGERETKRVAKQVKPWFYQSNNQYYFEVRNGYKAIEIQAGLHAIEVGDQANLLPIIETIIEAVLAGEFDKALTPEAKASKKSSK